MIQFILDFFLVKNLKDIAYDSDFQFMSPQTVLCLLERLEQSSLIVNRPSSGRNAELLEDILRCLWEKSALEAQSCEPARRKWLEVMGLCNSCLCSLIPDGTRDQSLTYLGDIQGA